MNDSHLYGIALSGGGARGIAHIGVLKALEEAKIYPEIVSGASAGSLIGLMYAAGIRPDQMMEIVRETSVFDLIAPSLTGLGLSDLSKLQKLLQPYVPTESFEGLKRPFYVSVTNFNLGTNEIISSGPLWEVILASCSIPILFKAREINGFMYVDGGVLNNLPTDPLRPQCHCLIGVNVMPVHPDMDIKGLSALTYRTLELVLWNNVAPRLKQCDVVIAPACEDYGLFDIQKAEELYELGYLAAKQQLSAIHAYR